MADQKISQLPTITGANMADNDKFVLVDTSGDATVATTREEFFKSVPNVTFGNNDKAIFGAGSDLEIYHDGANSIIEDTSTGNLQLITNGNAIALKSSDGDAMLSAIKDGDVKLYYNNNLKLTTTATGVDVNGTVTSDGLTVDGDIIQTGGDEIQNSGTLRLSGDYDGSGAGNVEFKTKGILRQQIANGGSISFYEDTGNTPKFHWDASAESLGIGQGVFSGTQALNLKGEGIAIKNDKSGSSNNWSLIRNTGTSSTSNVSFVTGTGEAMVLAHNKNVGIGTSSPDYPLHVKGTTNILKLETSSDGRTQLGGYDSSGNTNFLVGSTDSTNAEFWNYKNGYLRFATNSTERMRIDSSGNVGIGVVPDNWSGTGTAIQLKGTGHVATANQYAYFGSNYYYNSGWKYTTSSTAAQYRQDSGSHQFLNATSGTADSAIAWSEAMRIDSSGNLLVGRTSSSGVDTDGHVLFENGVSYQSNTDNGVQFVNRNGTGDGALTTFYKNGTTVGSIYSGHNGTQLGIGTNTTGITFNPSTRSMMPANPSSTNPQLDATLDIGFSSVRWKDLYLSEGLRADTLKFRTLAGSERMRINSLGNVGIGEANPTEKLEVDGTVKATSFEGDGSNLTGVGGSTNAGAVGTYMFANNSTSGTISTGATVAGSSLRPTSAGNPSNTSYTMSGTWRLMGHKTGTNTSYSGTYESSLWVRIS